MVTDMNMIFEYSDEAASIQTVTGWVSRRGHFYGADERAARYDGATHRICKVCDQPYEISAYCKPCNDKKNQDAFHAMPKKEWDGFTPSTRTRLTSILTRLNMRKILLWVLI